VLWVVPVWFQFRFISVFILAAQGEKVDLTGGNVQIFQKGYYRYRVVIISL